MTNLRSERTPQDTEPQAIREAVARLCAEFPALDASGLEATFMLVRTYAAVNRVTSEVLQPHGLAPSRFTVLRLLYYSPDGLTMTAIKEGLSVTPTNVTKLVDGLEKDGWVRRTREPRDRRVSYVRLTAAGKERFIPVLEELFSHLSSRCAGMPSEDKSDMVHRLSEFLAAFA